MAVAVVHELRERRPAASADDLEAFEQDVLAGFVLARSAAGLVDSTIRQDVAAVVEFREFLDRPVWTARPDDADRYLAVRCKGQAKNTLVGKAHGIAVFFQYLELRHTQAIWQLTGDQVTCPLDELNTPSKPWQLNLRIPPSDQEITRLFMGWRDELASTRKWLPAARNFAAARLWGLVGLRINETRMLDLADIDWQLGEHGKLHVRFGKGSRGRGPKQRMVPLINGARPLLAWYVTEVRGQFDDAWDRPGAPLLCSERHAADASCQRISLEALRGGFAAAVARHLPAWAGRLSPHGLRHWCASSLYRDGMDIIAIQELLGHAWIATTMGYVHVLRSHVEDSWHKAAERSARRLGMGLGGEGR